MEEADGTNDQMLNPHEFFVFADLTANRMFEMVNALDEESNWELDELYENLILQNPLRQLNGIDIYGAAYGTQTVIGEKQENFLKLVCHDTIQSLHDIGPSV